MNLFVTKNTQKYGHELKINQLNPYKEKKSVTVVSLGV